MLLPDFNEHVLKEGLLLPIGCIAIKSTRGEEEEEDVVDREELNFNIFIQLHCNPRARGEDAVGWEEFFHFIY